MTSGRKTEANRKNARRSSGPRSVAGKGRASRNALRHGLAVAVSPVPATPPPDVVRLARAIAGRNASDIRLRKAFAVAEAQFELRRVASARGSLMEPAVLVPSAGGTSVGAEATAFVRMLPRLALLDRYESRALGRLKRAVLQFDES
jgi:hypothetical protein